jgi:hypothetical protein
MPETKAEPVIRAFVARTTDINERKRSIVSRINTGGLDRYRTVIDPRGMDRSAYDRNKVVLWEHGRTAYGPAPIGRNEWVRPAVGPDGPELIAETVFFERGKKGDDFTERLWECYKDGDMRAWSVNVIPLDNCSPPTKDEIRDRPELVDCWMMYRRSELAEYSAVAVGGNADALTVDDARSILRCVDRGLQLPDYLVAQARRKTTTIDPAIVASRIGRDGGKFIVAGEDGTELARHDTEAEALEHLERQIGREKASPQLPPLGGRPYSEVRAEKLAAVRSLFDPAKIEAQIAEERDWLQGRV